MLQTSVPRLSAPRVGDLGKWLLVSELQYLTVLHPPTGDWTSLAQMLWGRKGAPCQSACTSHGMLKPLYKCRSPQLLPRKGLDRAWLPEAWMGSGEAASRQVPEREKTQGPMIRTGPYMLGRENQS